jgi:hypothetical protein
MLMPIRRDAQGRTSVFNSRAGIRGTLLIMGWCAAEGYAPPRDEYAFDPDRRWRFDLAWPEYKVALEIDGGVYTLGRHTRGAGYEADCRKMNAAAASGWTVFHATPQMLEREWPEIERVLRAAFDAKA